MRYQIGSAIFATASIISVTSQASPVPLFALSNPHTHFYTTSCFEADNAENHDGFKFSGEQAGRIEDTQQPGTVPFYRFFDGHTHFYTTSANAEGANAYVMEGKNPIGYVWTSGGPSLKPLYRAFNKTYGDHYYTSDPVSYQVAQSQYGYTPEGVVAFVTVVGTGACHPQLNGLPGAPPSPQPNGCSPPGAPACQPGGSP